MTITKERTTIPQSVRRQVLARDQHRCRKCGRRKRSLELHHIIPVPKNGPDTVENLISLCSSCHREWEYGVYNCVEGVPFEEWLDLPSIHELVVIFAKIGKEIPCDGPILPLYDIKSIIMHAHCIRRELRQWEDGEETITPPRKRRSGGPPRKMDTKKIMMAQTLYDARTLPIKAICTQLKISEATFYRYVTVHKEEQQQSV